MMGYRRFYDTPFLLPKYNRKVIITKTNLRADMFTVLFTDYFINWLDGLSLAEKESVLHLIKVLQAKGHQLNRPYADTIKGSKLKNLKELRVQHSGDPYRILFIFDPLRQAVLLCGGNKTGDKRFYDRMIPIAEKSYRQYLKELKNG